MFPAFRVAVNHQVLVRMPDRVAGLQQQLQALAQGKITCVARLLVVEGALLADIDGMAPQQGPHPCARWPGASPWLRMFRNARVAVG